MKVRVLNDTVPAWLAPHLEGHRVVVGEPARRWLHQLLDGAHVEFVPPTKETGR